jgi:hypothetical protein
MPMNNPVTQDVANICEHMRSQVLSSDKSITDLSIDVGVPYPRLRYFAKTPGVIPNDNDLAKLLAFYMPGYVLVPRQVAPASDAA